MKKLTLKLIAAALFSNTFVAANAAVITFDDIVMDTGRDYGYVENGYMGFRWTGSFAAYGNGWVVSPRVRGWSGGDVVPPSGPNYVFSNGSDSLQLFAADEGLFDLIGFSARLGVVDGTSQIRGYRAGELIFSQDFYSSLAFQRYDFNFTNVDRIAITNNPSNLLLDNVEVARLGTANEIPEPSTMALTALGLAGALLSRRRLKASCHR